MPQGCLYKVLRKSTEDVIRYSIALQALTQLLASVSAFASLFLNGCGPNYSHNETSAGGPVLVLGYMRHNKLKSVVHATYHAEQSSSKLLGSLVRLALHAFNTKARGS